MLWAGGEEMATSSLHVIDGVPAMPQPNDLSRSLVALDQNSTIIAVIEMSQSSWLVRGMLPGIYYRHHPRAGERVSVVVSCCISYNFLHPIRARGASSSLSLALAAEKDAVSAGTSA
jgi:hypothetical protein